jgi:hypothetical protein
VSSSPQTAAKEATIVHGGREHAVFVGVANNPCPACGRRSLRVYAPCFRALGLARGFLADGFLAKCRRPDCALAVLDFREAYPDGGWYGNERPHDDDLLGVPVSSALSSVRARKSVVVGSAPVRVGEYASEERVLLADPGSLTGDSALEELDRHAQEAAANGRIVLVAPSVLRAWFPRAGSTAQ